MINPINHSSNTELASLYRVEPYVIAADVYGQSPHTGRGGWSWYTGSAGWCYRLVVEDLLGVRLHGNVLHVRPLLPDDWPSCAIHVRHGDTTFYHLNFQRSGSGSSVIAVEVDGVAHPNPNIDMVDDGNHHHVQIKIGGK